MANSLVYNVIARDQTGPGLAKAAANVKRAEKVSLSAEKAALRMALGAGVAAGKFVGLAGGAAVAASSIVPALGVMAAVPGVAFGAAAGVGALGLAFSGLGKAWSAAGAAGGGGGGMSAAARARQVAQAHREVRDAAYGVTEAQRELRESTDNLNRSWREASERLEDLSRDLREAHLDEADAVDAVEEAAERLNEARQRGGTEDIDDAQRAYDRSRLSLERVRDRVDDLKRESTEETKKGVAGSDEVTEARLRQQDAVRGLQRATERLADAQAALAEAGQSGGGGGMSAAQDAMDKLSPAGRELITVLKKIGPAWSSMRKAVQQATLVGVAGDIEKLSDAQLPTLRRRLVEVGAGWNVGFREALKMARSKEFVADTDEALGNAAKSSRNFARSLAPVWSGLRHIGVVGSSFLPGMADTTLTLAQRFERWAKAGRETGRFESWIRNGITTLKQWGTVAGNIGATMSAIYKGGSGAAGQGFLAWLVDATGRMRAWSESVRGQEVIGRFFDTLGRVVHVAAEAWDAFTEGGLPVVGILSALFRVAELVLGSWEDWGPTIGGVARVLIPLAVGLRAVYTATMLVQKGSLLAATAIKGIGAASSATPWGAIATAAYGLGYALGWAIDHADELVDRAGDLARELLGVKPLIGGVAKQSKVWSDVMGVLNNKTAKEVSALVALDKAMDSAFNRTLNANEAAIRWEEALDGVTASVKENGRSLDITTPSGQANARAINGAAEAAWEMRRANIANNMEVGEANRRYQESINKLVGVGKQAGLSKSELDKLSGQYRIEVMLNLKTTGAALSALNVGGAGVAGAILTALSKAKPRAKGGPVAAGSPYLVGEQGPEIVVPDSDGTVLTAAQTSSARRGGGGLAAAPTTVVIEVRSGGSRMDDLLVEILRKAIKDRGGNVQKALSK